MLRKTTIITAVLLLFVAATSFAETAGRYNWKLESDEDGCQVYTSEIAGREYIASKATCVIPARLETIGVVFVDFPNYPEWLSDCKEMKVIKVIDEEKDIFILWLHQHIPLLTDRDAVLKSSTVYNYEKGFTTVVATSTNEMTYDSTQGFVRMPTLTSEFTLVWVDREHTKVTFMTDPDLGKGLPKGISNSTIKKMPLKSLKGLIKMVKMQKYIDKGKTSKYAKLVEDAIKAGDLK